MQASQEVKQQLEVMEDSLARAGIATPRLSAAVEELNGKVSEMQSQLTLLQHRSESAVRLTQLAPLQQSMMTLEKLVKESVASVQGQLEGGAGELAARLTPYASAVSVEGAPAEAPQLGADEELDGKQAQEQEQPTVPVSAAVSPQELEALTDRLARMEVAVAELRELAAETDSVVGSDVPALKKSVAEMQLIIFELRQAQAKQDEDEDEEMAGAGVVVEEVASDDEQPGSPVVTYPGFGRAESVKVVQPPREDEFCAFEDAPVAADASAPAVAEVGTSPAPQASPAGPMAALKQRVEVLESSLMSKVQALEAQVFAIAPSPGAQQQARATELLEQLPAHVDATMQLRNEVDELQAAFNTMRGQLDSVRLSIGVATPRRGPSGDGSSLPLGSGGVPATALGAALANVSAPRSVLDNVSVASVPSNTAQLESDVEQLRAMVQKLGSDVQMLHGNLESMALPATMHSESVETLKGQLAKLDERVQALTSASHEQQAALVAVAASASEASAQVHRSSITLPLHLSHIGREESVTLPVTINLDDGENDTPTAAADAEAAAAPITQSAGSSAADSAAAGSAEFAEALSAVSARMGAIEATVTAQNAALDDLHAAVSTVQELRAEVTRLQDEVAATHVAATSAVAAARARPAQGSASEEAGDTVGSGAFVPGYTTSPSRAVPAASAPARPGSTASLTSLLDIQPGARR